MWRIVRWFIALGEIGGGALMLSLAIHPLPTAVVQSHNGWASYLAEGLGVAAIVAGVSLLRNTPSGYRMSLSVQAIQILRIYGGKFIFAVIIGPQILINFAGPGSIPMGGPFGFAATLYLTLSGTALASAEGIGINVLALTVAWELLMHMPNESK